MVRRATVWTPLASSGRRASSHRRFHGTVTTHCRVATCGSTRSTHQAEVAAIRRPPHRGQKPRPLQAKVTRRWWSQPAQCSHAKPLTGSPHPRNPSSSFWKCRGSARPTADRAPRSVARPSRTTGWSRSVAAPRSATTQDTTPGRSHTPCRDVRGVRPGSGAVGVSDGRQAGRGLPSREDGQAPSENDSGWRAQHPHRRPSRLATLPARREAHAPTLPRRGPEDTDRVRGLCPHPMGAENEETQP